MFALPPTHPVKTVPEDLEPPTIEMINASSFHLVWTMPDEPNGVITSFNLIVARVTGGPITFNFNASQTSFVVSGDFITPYTLFQFLLQACNRVGCTTSQGVEARSGESLPKGMAPPVVVALKDGRVSVSWNPPTEPNGKIIQYEVLQVNGTIDGSANNLPENARRRRRRRFDVSLEEYCQQFSQIDCGSTSSNCTYNTEADVCEPLVCPSIFDETTCRYTTGCIFLSGSSACFDADAEIDCDWFFSETSCEIDSIMLALNCTFFEDSALCWRTAEIIPCSLLSTEQDCQTQNHCIFADGMCTLADSPTIDNRTPSTSSLTNDAQTITAVTSGTTTEMATPTTTTTTSSTDNTTERVTSASSTTATEGTTTERAISTATTTTSIDNVTTKGETLATSATSTASAASAEGTTKEEAATTSTVGVVTSLSSSSTELEDNVSLNQVIIIEGIAASNIPLSFIALQYQSLLDNAADVKIEVGDLHSDVSTVIIVEVVVNSPNVKDSIDVMQDLIFKGWLLVRLQVEEPTNFRDVTISIVKDSVEIFVSTTVETTTSLEPSTTTQKPPQPVAVFRGIETQVIVDGLDFNRNYSFSVIVFNSAGATQSNFAHVRTVDGPPVGIPKPLLEQDTPTSLLLLIQPPDVPNSDSISYNVFVNKQFYMKTDDIEPVVIKSLQPFTDYSIHVQACSPVACTDSLSSVARTLPGPPESVQTPKTIAQSVSSILATWQPPMRPNGILLDYKVWLRELQVCSVEKYREENDYVVQPPDDLPKPVNLGVACHFIMCPKGSNPCGLTCYNPINETCCDGQVHVSRSGFSCCETLYIASGGSDSVCCGGQFHQHRADFSCCDGVYLPITSDQVCCNGQIEEGNECCGDQGFFNTPETPRICCDGQVLDSFGNRQCCGSRLVQAHQICCGDEDVGEPFSPK